MVPTRKSLKLGAALAAVALLAGCGGSGGGVSSTPPIASAPTPAPAPTPVPTPTPTPPATNFNTAEARRTDSFAFHNALTAYNRNITGAGVIAGVIDSGIDIDSPEYAGRIHPQSFDATGGGRSIDAEGSHGTQVAQILAGAKNDVGTFGIAYDASLLVLRADRAGSCAGTSPDAEADGCRYPESAIAAGLDRAVAAGARVVNISLGGDTPPGFTLRQAVARATAAGVIIVASAGNSGDTTADGNDPNNPEPFAQGLRDAGGDLVIIVGSVDENRAISDFSNRAGNYAGSYLTALGDSVCCVYQNGVLQTETTPSGTFVFLLNGTSFAAPQVAGAIALVAQGFPSLTPQQIVALLYQSAQDAGAAGNDAVFGRGILDVGRAFSPIGATSLAGTNTRVALSDPLGTLGAPMGDARGSALGVITDGFGRAFNVDLAPGLVVRGPALRLLPALDQQGVSRVAARGPTALSLTVVPQPGEWAASPLSFTGDRRTRALAASLVTKLGARDRLGFAAGRALDGLLAGERGLRDTGHLIAHRAGDATAPLLDPSLAALWRHDARRWGQITLLAENGWVAGRGLEDDPRRSTSDPRDSRYTKLGVGWDRRFGALALALTAQRLREDGSLLGARFGPLFGAGGATSHVANAGVTLQLPGGWSLAGEWTGLTARPDRAGLVAGGTLRARALSMDVARSGLAWPGDRLALRYAEPLRVTAGGLGLDLPISYDEFARTADFGRRILALSPSGREKVVELGYHLPLGDASLGFNGWWRQDPGHFAAIDDDLGAAVRFTLGY